MGKGKQLKSGVNWRNYLLSAKNYNYP